jgi:hypothetical protein
MSSFKHLYVVDAIPKNIFLLCQCLKPPYVMTFDVIPISFFTFLNRTKNNIDNGPGPPQKKLEQCQQTFSMLIFLGVETVVDVNHLLPSMLIFLLLLPHPQTFCIYFKQILTLFENQHPIRYHRDG